MDRYTTDPNGRYRVYNIDDWGRLDDVTENQVGSQVTLADGFSTMNPMTPTGRWSKR